MSSLVTHRPYGIEHPYAVSPDQRVPVVPHVGRSTTLGVQAAPEVTAVACEWRDRDGSGEVQSLSLEPVTARVADAAALAGGEGHLAEAQAASIGGEGAWAVESPVLDDVDGYEYRFVAATGDGRSEE